MKPKLNWIELAQAGVQGLQPYQGGKPLAELQREYGIREAIKLASNENPLGPSPLAITAVNNCLQDVARYPDGNAYSLKQALANKLGVPANRLTLGNGSNDVLELVARAYAGAGNEVLFSQHSFAVYPIVTQAVGAKAVVVPARAWGNDLEGILAAITDRTRIIFIANPNNPTGTWLTTIPLYDFLRQVPAKVIVVLDEAYFEYASDPELGISDFPDGTQWLDEFSNLMVTRTFSKAYGLAGLRVGYGMSTPQIAEVLNRVRQPFNLNSLALAGAEAALDDHAHLSASVKLNATGMRQYETAFQEMGLEYIPSAGNFISVKVGNGVKVYDDLLYKGVITRPVANYAMPEFLRISIGTTPENQRAIAALKSVLGKS